MFKKQILFSLSVICCLIFGSVNAHSFELSSLFKDQKAVLKSTVDIAHSIIVYFENQTKKGLKTTEEAQEEVRNILRAARYQKFEYFWITDLEANMIMHGAKPPLEGKNLLKFRTQKGKELFKEITQNIEQAPSMSLFTEYYWPKAGEEKPVKKIAFSRLTPGWKWVISSSMYEE